MRWALVVMVVVPAYAAQAPAKPGQRVIEIWHFLHAVGGGGLVGLRY